MLRGWKLGLDNFLDREELGSILDVKSTFFTKLVEAVAGEVRFFLMVFSREWLFKD